MFSLRCVVILCVALAASGFDITDQDIQYHLFTRSNPGVSQPLSPTINSIIGSNFHPQHRTIITIHTNGEGVGGNFNAFCIRAHLGSEDVNVLAIDWTRGSVSYVHGLANAVQCGERIAQFIDWLFRSFNYSPSMYRIVGHGLGGHIAGIVSRKVTTGKIPQVIAIDPSFHGWTHHPDKLRVGDAELVEVLHCTAGSLGYDRKLGDLDFYANGGSHQPGCGSDVSCSHTLCYAYYGESISQYIVGGNRFVGTACNNQELAMQQSCNGTRDAIFGGVSVKNSGNGYYSFQTNLRPPFARG